MLVPLQHNYRRENSVISGHIILRPSEGNRSLRQIDEPDLWTCVTDDDGEQAETAAATSKSS